MAALARKCKGKHGFLDLYSFGVRYEVYRRFKDEPEIKVSRAAHTRARALFLNFFMAYQASPPVARVHPSPEPYPYL